MKYADIYYCDIANGIGCRTSLFVSGCTHHCKGCFNECAWDFDYGDLYTKEVEDKIIDSINHSYISGLSILGGEPMEIGNQKEIRKLIERVKKEVPEATIWIYSGYTWEELHDINNKRCHGEDTEYILNNINVLIDGEFVEELKDIKLKFRGSSNQRIINVKQSNLLNKIVLLEL